MYKRSRVLRLIRLEMQKGLRLTEAMERVGVRSRATLKIWRDKSPRVGRYLEALMLRADERRVDIIENAHYKAAAEGSVRAQENILFNRRPERWKKDTGDVVRRGDAIEVNVNVMPTKVLVFKDLGDDRRKDLPHAGEGTEGHRGEGEIQGP